ncbi:VOC family protein [Mesorhizobium xinjiangense]|uniref:VOC family protein n=1 Tax=Mesorhizobium xinjiangense TaxID=2678685 RepID=UPI0012ECE1D2|nr:VOC family protein [Mesorhizobium xinjiangense]
MHVRSLDHIVLCVADVAATRRFYERILGMEPREERPGKWALFFGANKISLQDARAAPDIARNTVPGSGNFCLLTDVPIADVAKHLQSEGIPIAAGPVERAGALGRLNSIYLRDLDGNLVEVANQL